MRSCKICVLDSIDTSKFTKQPFYFGGYLPYADNQALPPTTAMSLASDSINVDDFVKYKIDHEVEEKVFGRIPGGNSFDGYIRKGFIDGFVSQKRGLVILSGKKRDILDFCAANKKMAHFKFHTVGINMKKLLALLPNVKVAWFNFDKGEITSSALMGHCVENTPEFKNCKDSGEISTLSFHFDYGNALHPILITKDGTVVLQANYQERTDEIELVLKIKEALLDKVIELPKN